MLWKMGMEASDGSEDGWVWHTQFLSREQYEEPMYMYYQISLQRRGTLLVPAPGQPAPPAHLQVVLRPPPPQEWLHRPGLDAPTSRLSLQTRGHLTPCSVCLCT